MRGSRSLGYPSPMQHLPLAFLLLGAMTPPPPGGYGQDVEIRYAHGLVIPFSEADKLWTAKLVQGEGARTREEAQVIIWALVQRRYWGVGMRTPNPRAFAGYSTWRQYIRTFSQALNPKWYRTGEFCRPGGRYAAGSYCSVARLQRREELLHARWGDLTPLAREAAQDFVDGKLPNNAPGVIDFRDDDGVVVNRPLAELPFPVRNRYFYSHGSTSREWAGSGIEVSTARLGGAADLLLALVPGGPTLLAVR